MTFKHAVDIIDQAVKTGQLTDAHLAGVPGTDGQLSNQVGTRLLIERGIRRMLAGRLTT
eukprot:SAG31_NODE_26505_length_441_cov_0.754386_2_plen_58_part_01